MEIELKKASLSDARLLFDWRNDQATRMNSKNQDQVEWQDHIKWLESSLDNRDRDIYIAYSNHTAVGMVRADHHNSIIELSWTVAPDRRNEGHGTTMLKEAIKLFNGDKTLYAIIKMDNGHSIKMATACGFYFDTISNGLGVWKIDKRRSNGSGNELVKD